MVHVLIRFSTIGAKGLNLMLDSFPTRAAWALCTFAYSMGPGTEPVLFEGRTDGKIVPARGPPKFGWDPVFEAEDTGLTYVCSFVFMPHSLCVRRLTETKILFFSYAEMGSTQKNALSHRGRALQKLRAYLQAQGEGGGVA